MTNTNCQNCDRDQCPTLFATFARMPTASRNRAMADCANHTVNWRARALTEAARADAAVAQAAYWPHAAMVAHTLRGRIMALDVAMQTIRGAELNNRQSQALALVERAIAELQAEADRVAAMIGEP